MLMNAEVAKRKRASKYKRKRGKAAPLQFGGKRDQEIIRAVGTYRFAWSSELNDLLVAKGHTSRKKNWERIRRLVDAGYLDFPDRQPANLDRNPGSLPSVVALGDRGADEYFRMTGWTAPKVSWRDKNREIGYDSITHHLIGSTTMLMLECDLAKDGRYRLVPLYELPTNLPLAVQSELDPTLWTLSVSLQWEQQSRTRVEGSRTIKHRVPVKPDGTFAIERIADGKRVLCFREDDNKSEVQKPTSTRRFNEKPSPFKKNVGFYHSLLQGVVKKHFGLDGFLVLWVTTGAAGRAANIANRAYEACEGTAPNMFRITTLDAIKERSSTLAAPWINARGDEKPLLPDWPQRQTDDAL